MSRLLFVTLPLLLTFGCVADDVSGDSGESDTADASGDGGASDGGAADGGSSDGGEDAPALVGAWLSDGANVSDLLSYYGYLTVSAEFNEDGSYSVEASTDATTDSYAGTWQVDTSTTPHSITLSQASPTSAEAAGIWEITDDTMRYEVVDLSAGCTVPTPDAGFGSTSCDGQTGTYNVQKFVRQ